MDMLIYSLPSHFSVKALRKDVTAKCVSNSSSELTHC